MAEDDDIVIPSFGKKKTKTSTGIVIPKFDDEPEEESSGILGKVKDIWNKANTPLVDVSPTMRKAMDETEKEHPYIGKVGNFLADTMISGSSPVSLGLEAATLGALKVPALSKVGKVVGAGALAHGGIGAVQALRKGDYPGALAGGLEAGIGGLGLRGGKAHLEAKIPGEAMEVKPPVFEQRKPLALPPSSLETKPSFISGPEGTSRAPMDAMSIDRGPQIPEANLRNIGAGVKTITRPEGLPVIDAEVIADAVKPIAPTKSPKEAVSEWANGRRAAHQYGRNAATDFKELTDPSLIDKYQKGDRSGQLADVETHLENLRQAEVKAGVLPEDAKKANYLRQYWEDPPEKVDQIFAGIISQNPNFAKESVFKSYAQGRAAGLTPKFETLPEILEARTADSVRAIKNKQFYDYLKDSGKLKAGVSIPDTQDIDKLGKIFRDPESPETKKLITYMGNYLGDSSPLVKKVADATSLTKNMYLGGGVPNTKYNMHGWNTMKSDSKLRGFGNGMKEFFTDPTGKTAEKMWDDKGNRDTLAKLMEHGYTYHPVSDSGHEVSQVFGKVASKIIEKGQDLFEKPLFDKALPATKFKGAKYALDKLTASGMSEEEAIKHAAQIANEFYGGINKVLRNKTDQNLARIFALAPDWLESRVKLAMHDWKGMAKTVTGQGSAKDKIYAKSFARGAGIAGVGAVGAAQLGRNDKPQDVTNIPMGKDAKGKSRLLDVLGTADEAMRLPIQIPLRAMQGNPMSALDMLGNNKMSLPAKGAMHLLTGKDDLGNSIRGKDKYGKQIDATTSMRKHIGEVAAPFVYQGAQGFYDFVTGNASGEEATSKALELPIKYEQGAKQKKSGLGRLK